MLNVLICVLSYLICSLNPAIIISKKVLKKDIRELGSKNAGTTNAVRILGKRYGALVFILDALKAIISFFAALLIFKIFGQNFANISKSLVLLSGILGHIYPIYYNFKGGKGVAIYIIFALLIDARAALVCIAVGVILIAITRWVSLGSICGCGLLVIISMFMKTNFNIWIILISTMLIVYKHRSNISRILSGTENKLF